ncbi:MAG: Hsp20/alpha crystallin family protein [Deltaproteobacteria bacterium]
MMRFTVRDPWAYGALEAKFNKMIDETLKNFYPYEAEPKFRWSPAVDIRETAEGFIVRADVPGIAKDEIRIDVKDSTLTISGEKKSEDGASDNNYVRVERVSGTFARSFSLPKNVDSEKIKATYRDGVLELILPKRDEAQLKQIKVEIN